MPGDFYLKIDGISGESQDDNGHKDEIELESWSFGGINDGSFSNGGGGGVGTASLHEFSFVKRLDKASPLLFKACCSGKHFETVTAVMRKSGESLHEYLKVTLTHVLVSSYQTGAGATGSEAIPRDHVSLNFGKIELAYKDQKADGSLGGEVIGGWNAETKKVV